MSAKVAHPQGLKQGVFRYTGILEVLHYQFRPTSDSIALEMSLTRQNADEEEGIILGGFSLVQVKPPWNSKVIYINSVYIS